MIVKISISDCVKSHPWSRFDCVFDAGPYWLWMGLLHMYSAKTEMCEKVKSTTFIVVSVYMIWVWHVPSYQPLMLFSENVKRWWTISQNLFSFDYQKSGYLAVIHSATGQLQDVGFYEQCKGVYCNRWRNLNMNCHDFLDSRANTLIIVE